MKRTLLSLILAWSLVGLMAPAAARALPAGWQAYQDRYAIIIMGGDEACSGTRYMYYWIDTFAMYNELIDRGFGHDRIRFLSYGDSAVVHPSAVDDSSTTVNIRAAYQWAASSCDDQDLLYIYWVDHGTSNGYFVTHDAYIAHTELGTLTAAVNARQVIGAYNPCFSGAVIDDLSGPNVISVTSQDPDNPNSWGWAGYWLRAITDYGGQVDVNGDGVVSIAEAFDWIAPYSYAAGEHSMYDDDGDGVGHLKTDAGYDPTDPDKDGFLGRVYSIDGWRSLKWVDFAYTGPENGTRAFPYNTLGEAEYDVASGGVIAIKGGTSSETPVLDKPVEIFGWGGTVTIGE